jgi:hypothetical protein
VCAVLSVDIKTGHPTIGNTTGTVDKVKVKNYKGTTSWVQVKSSLVLATYPLVDQAAVMDAGFG